MAYLIRRPLLVGDLAQCVYVKRLCSNCRCDVSTLAESWKIMYSRAYMRPEATPSIRHERSRVIAAVEMMVASVTRTALPFSMVKTLIICSAACGSLTARSALKRPGGQLYEMRAGSPIELGDLFGEARTVSTGGHTASGRHRRAVAGSGRRQSGEGKLGAASRAILWPSRLRSVAEVAVVSSPPWTGSWTGVPVNAGAMSAIAG